jgi:hypothetical protein
MVSLTKLHTKKESIKIKVSLYKLKKKQKKGKKVNAATNDHTIMSIENSGRKKGKSQQVKLLLDIDVDIFNHLTTLTGFDAC